MNTENSFHVCVFCFALSFSVLTAKEVQVESKLTADKRWIVPSICISPEMRRWLPM